MYTDRMKDICTEVLRDGLLTQRSVGWSLRKLLKEDEVKKEDLVVINEITTGIADQLHNLPGMLGQEECTVKLLHLELNRIKDIENTYKGLEGVYDFNRVIERYIKNIKGHLTELEDS